MRVGRGAHLAVGGARNERTALPVSSNAPAASQGHAGRRYVLGFALGWVPPLLMIVFGATQCPPLQYTCHDPNQGIGGWLFVAAVALYGVEALALIICLFIRRVRPVGFGLLTMAFLGPIIGIYGFLAISFATHPVPR